MIMHVSMKTCGVCISRSIFDMTKPPSLKFYTKVTDESQQREVENVYVAISEVVAITPDQGFRIGRSRSLDD